MRERKRRDETGKRSNVRLRMRETEEDVQKQQINGQRRKKKKRITHNTLLMLLRPVRRQTARVR